MSNPQDVNREISWLHFNARVLQEAEDKANPLLERVRFLGIYSNNNDEFFRVRIAVLSRLMRINEQESKSDKQFTEYDVEAVYNQVMVIQHEQQFRFQTAWENLLNELAEERIFLVHEQNLNSGQAEYVRAYFNKMVRPLLSPILLSKVDGTSLIRDNAVYLAVDLFSTRKELKERYALIEIPAEKLGRFIVLPTNDGNHYIMFLDDIIRYCLSDIFGIFGYDEFLAYTIKITRDAELDIDHDISRSFMQLMEQSIKRRAQGDPVRFVYDNAMPEKLLHTFSQKLKLTKQATFFPGGRYHNFRDLMSFPNLGRPELMYAPMPPIISKQLPLNKSIIKAMATKDILLYYPYHSFITFTNLLSEAALDPKVRAIKVTLYRVAKESNVINALINAARNGKRVTVFFEFQARFDEELNIYYTNMLQSEGVNVVSSIPGFKVHSKLLLIRRKESGFDKYYTAIATGNFNESTSKLYTDVMLFTAHQEIANEVNQVFHLFDEKFLRPEFKHLFVSPFQQRLFIDRMLDREIANAEMGKEAWAKIKLNNLVDLQVVEKIRSAARKGVKLQLMIRGICVLVPTNEDLKNMEIISVVDRFLEHSRLFLFCNDGKNEAFLSSADWMKRNLDHRIEVTCPIYNPKHINTLKNVFEIGWSDNVKSRIQDGTGSNSYRHDNGKTPIQSQKEIYNYYLRNS